MNERKRNLAVGITVIIALIMLSVMILLFTGLPTIFHTGYRISILADATHDAHEGDAVYLAGLAVGRVESIRFTDRERPDKGVTFVVAINSDVLLPGDTKAFFFTKGVVGAAYIELKGQGESVMGPAGQPLASLPTDGTAVIPSVHVGSGMFPQELTDAFKSFGKLAENLNALLAEEQPVTTTAAGGGVAATGAATQPSGVALRGTLAKLNASLDAFTTVMGDPENQSNIKQTLANLAKATAGAADAATEIKTFATEAAKAAQSFQKLGQTSEQRLDELSRKLIADAEKLSDVLTTLNKAIGKIESGQGTAGKLVNDPDLYNSLLAATRQTTKLVEEMRDMVAAWKKSGVPIKVK